MLPRKVTSLRLTPDRFRRALLATAALALVVTALTAVPATLAHPDLGVRVVDTTECERSDPDAEWVEVRNDGDATVDLSGWSLKNSAGTASFTFPVGSTLAHDESVKVWTGDAGAAGGLSFGLDHEIWLNPGEGEDAAVLLDANGVEAHRLACQNRIQVLDHESTEDAVTSECVTGLVRNAHVFPERVNLTWDSVPGATEYHVFVAEDGGAWVELSVVRNEGLIDETAESGKSYTYVVSAHGSLHPEVCVATGHALDVSVIPFFPGFAATALAALGGVGALVVARRK